MDAVESVRLCLETVGDAGVSDTFALRGGARSNRDKRETGSMRLSHVSVDRHLTGQLVPLTFNDFRNVRLD